MNKHKIGDIVNTMGHWFRVIGVTGNRLSIRSFNRKRGSRVIP